MTKKIWYLWSGIKLDDIILFSVQNHKNLWKMVGNIWCCHLKVNNLCYAKLETRWTNGLSVKICCYSQLAFLRNTLLSCVGAKKAKWLKVLWILYGNWLVLMGLCFYEGHSFPRVKSYRFYRRFCWFNVTYFRCYKQEKKFYYWYPLHG